ncbi:MAG: hypothetical protein U0640_10570 [Phycisphaerales bacterium]
MKNMKNVFGLALVASCGLAMPVLAQVTETEPNETKANADTVGVINLPAVNGPALTGTTTGASTTTPGLASADTFRVRTAVMTPGIYRNRLIITTGGTVGHGGTIRGLAQPTVGTITPGSDNIAQTASTATTPARFNQWYTFGPASEMYYRVTGGSTTTAPYVVNYEVAPVATIPVVGTITAGNVQIRDTGSNDIDFWVYDSSFNPIAGFGSDEPEATGVTRSMVPGTYYLAFARFSGMNNLASAAPETFGGTVLDFPGAFLSGSNTAGTVIPTFTSSSGTVTATTTTFVANTNAFDVPFYQFTVTAPANPIVNSVIATPASGPIGSTTTVVATVTPAPDLVAITGVSLDASQINAGTVTLLDNGIAPDVTAGDNLWTANVTVGVGSTIGSKTLTATATDASARTASGTGTFGVTPANDNCANGTPLNNAGPFPYNVGPIDMTGYTVDGNWTGCFTVTPSGPDAWYTFTAPSDGILALSTCIADTGGATTRDTLLGIATSCGSSFVVCEDDESGTCGLASKISLNVTGGTTYWVSYRQWGATTITDGLMQVNFIPGTPLSVSNINTTNSTIFTNGAPSSTIVTAQVTPASIPPSTGITVSINATAAGLGTITMLDDGVAPDAAIDGIYTASISSTGATLGAYNFTVTATDLEARTANGTFAQTIDQLDEAGETVATSAIAPDATTFNGRFNNTTDVDMYKIFICDPATFSATTVGGLTPPGTGTGSDTSLYLFKPDGTGVSFNDDLAASFNSTLDNTQVLVQGAGEYYLAIAYFANDPFDTSALEMWLDTPFTGTRAPDGPGAAGTLGDWVGAGTIANYTLTLTGVSLTPCGPVCNDIDFNNDGSLFDPQDIDAFLSVYSEGPCIPDTATCDGIDFNNDTSVFDPCDISSFLQVFSEGPCELCPL